MVYICSVPFCKGNYSNRYTQNSIIFTLKTRCKYNTNEDFKIHFYETLQSFYKTLR